MSYEYDAAFYEAFEEEAEELEKLLPKGHKYFFTWKSIQESDHIEPIAGIISTRTQSKFPISWIDKINAVITRSTGYDHVSAYFRECGKSVDAAYLPEYAARAVAEQAMILWTSLLRILPLQLESMSTFHRDGLTGREIRGRNLSVLATGRIGRQIVDIAHGLGMNVTGFDISPDESLAAKYPGFKYASLEEALCNADVLVCALPLTDKTNRMLDRKMLGLVKKGAVFVNIARGEISPTEDLLELLEAGILSGIGLDVYDCEKDLASVLRGGASLESIPEERRKTVAATLKLMRDTRAILTPHNAFNTEESVHRKSLETSKNLDAYFRTGRFISPILS